MPGDDFLEHDPSGEDEDDLNVQPVGVSLQPTDWTVGTILDQMRRGRIELNPRFQRREVWTDDKKSRFIESLALNLPIPQIVLAEREERKGSYIVIDGKQRLLTLRRFGADTDDPDFPQLKLTGLKTVTALNNKTWETLDRDSTRNLLETIENQTLRTIVIRDWVGTDFLHLVFLRLNTGSVNLSPQELRQALFPGPFTEFAESRAASSKALTRVFGKETPDFRMRDVEVLIRFYMFKHHLADYRGNLKAALDHTCDDLNNRWTTEPALAETADECDSAIETTYRVFGANAFMRWSGTSYEGRFNRAIFDVMTYYFSNDRVATAAVANKQAVIAAFKKLCTSDDDFRESIQTTTKSVNATFTRLSRWGTVLKAATNRSTAVQIPKLVGKRIEP